MSSLVKLELYSILSELSRIQNLDYLPIGVHREISRSIDNLSGSIRMFEEFHGKGQLLIPTESNTAYARYTGGELTLIFKGKELSKGNIDPGPGIMSIILDTCALYCNNSEVEFLRIEVSRDTLDCQTMNMNEYLERLAAFSATTNTIVIMPPELVIAIKVSDTSTKEEPKPTVSFGEDEVAITEAEERLKSSGSKIETKD